MRISDWSSDVCSSDLSRSRLLRPPPATARRRGCGYPPRRGRGAAAATPGATASCIHQPAAVEPQHAAAARGEVFVVGHQYQRGARVGVHREQQLDHRLSSEEHTSELQSLMRISYPVLCLNQQTPPHPLTDTTTTPPPPPPPNPPIH